MELSAVKEFKDLLNEIQG